jgi:hypothetical protein
MTLEVSPAVPEAQRLAVSHAVERAGIRLDGRPEAYASAWWRTAAQESVENVPAPVRYVLSPRSTRGATRA